MTRTHLKIVVVVLLAVALLSVVRHHEGRDVGAALAENGIRVTGTLHESDAPCRGSPWVTIDFTATDANRHCGSVPPELRGFTRALRHDRD